eukprot:TRINITY_DN6261_c0_g1_i1.p1 TRINITY_DN6261_c0_g1~~TRINITY_DN6261_c0_g1_i1.p1  ORF type:complete len:349 (+),score=58.97 TRINITY_DN6261_c0_g1_i1:1028-2074(+)
MSSKLKKPTVSGKTTVFQSKGARKTSSTAPSGSLSPRSAVFSAGLGPPTSGQPSNEKRLQEELSKVKEERDRFSRQAANAKCQLAERDNEVKNLQKIIDSNNQMPNGVTGSAAEQQNYFKAVIQNMPDNTSINLVDYLQRWNNELLIRIRDQALEIAELTTQRSGSGGQEDLVKSLSKQVADMSQRLKDCKMAASQNMSPMTSPPVSPPPKAKDPVTRSASTGYQSSPSLPADLRKLLCSLPEPLSDDLRNRTFLSQLRDIASRLRITSNSASDDSRGYSNPNRVTLQPSAIRRSASAERLATKRIDAFQRTRSLGSKDKDKHEHVLSSSPAVAQRRAKVRVRATKES